jgi:hypothetical protein
MLLLLWLLVAQAILQLLPLLLYRGAAQQLHLTDLLCAITLSWLMVLCCSSSCRNRQLLLCNISGSSWCSCYGSCCSPVELPELFLQACTCSSFLL